MKLFLTFFILISISACTPRIPNVQTRLNLKMPILLDLKRFKSELPFKELRILKLKARQEQILMPNLSYSFIINQKGDVVNGKYNDKNWIEDFFSLKEYYHNVFEKYKWKPAVYKNTEEILSVMAEMNIYDNPERNRFELSIRLIYLVDKEKDKLDEINDQKNLIYSFSFK